MKRMILVPAAALVAGLAAPSLAAAQGPPVWVQEQILSRVMGGAGGQQARDAATDRRPGAILDRGDERINGCAPGLEVARRTPAGPVLGAIFGAGGPAAHARPGCGERDDERIGERQGRGDRRENARGGQARRGGGPPFLR